MRDWHEFDRISKNNFISWLSRRSALDFCVWVCVWGWATQSWQNKAAVLNRLLSLLSLTAAQRLNSDTAKKALVDSWTKNSVFSLLLEGSGSEGWDYVSLSVHVVYSFTHLWCSDKTGGNYTKSPLCFNLNRECTDSPKGQLLYQEKWIKIHAFPPMITANLANMCLQWKT